jgi:hypothetical protein
MTHDRLPLRTRTGAHDRFAGASLDSIRFVESPLACALGDTLAIFGGAFLGAETVLERTIFGALTSFDRSLPCALGGLLLSDPRRHALGMSRGCREGERKDEKNTKRAQLHGFTPIETV